MTMRCRWYILVFILLLTAGCGFTETERFVTEDENHYLPKDRLMGEWRVKDYKAGNLVSMNDTEARTFLDQRITIKEDSVQTLHGSECLKPDFKYIMEENPDENLYRGARVTTKDLGIDLNNLRQIEVYCDGSFLTNYYILEDTNRIMILWDGYWYFAERPPWYSRLYSWCLSWF